jgi:hypothetical protein
MDSPQRVVLDMDSTEIPIYGEQEQSVYNGHFESTCYHPLLLYGDGDCLGARLRPGNVHSAEDWDEVLPREIERQQSMGKEVVFRADAAFAKPEIYECCKSGEISGNFGSAGAALRLLGALRMKIVSQCREGGMGVNSAPCLKSKRRFRFSAYELLACDEGESSMHGVGRLPG